MSARAKKEREPNSWMKKRSNEMNSVAVKTNYTWGVIA